jgi:hypothetical protein
MSKLQENPSALKREHPALQKIKFINFFLCLWVILALPNPDCNPDPDTDPETPLNPDPDNFQEGVYLWWYWCEGGGREEQETVEILAGLEQGPRHVSQL